MSCTVCHQIAPDRLGTRESFNGNFVVAAPLANGKRRAFGPFEPDAGRRRIMHSVTGFEQEQATHIRESELCATCHTLITEALGPDGAGHRLAARADELPGVAAQRVLRGAAELPVVPHAARRRARARSPSVLGDYRESLSRHTFVGGNAFMLRLMNRYRAELGVEATPAELEATARATIRQLERETATVAIERSRGSPAARWRRRRGDKPDGPQVSDRISVASRVAPRDGARRSAAQRCSSPAA